MKKRNLPRIQRQFVILLFSIFLVTSSLLTHAQTISYMGLTPVEGQKSVLYVDNKPFYMTSIQVRLDKLRYICGWGASARDSIIGQAASDGFNTVGIPIQWYEVEPTKNNFDWSILDEYLGLCKKYNIKMELLWFGTNSGGHVQWLGDPGSNPVHTRTPDYVFYSPAPGSSATTSDYTILRSGVTYPNYILDINDANLKARETYVLGQVMSHISSWDAANGSKHTVIGAQLLNEFTGPWTSAQLVTYLSAIGSAVKNSSYVVWTRMNTVNGDQTNRTNANEALRSSSGTNLDFVGVDLYGIGSETIRTAMPYTGKNYRMIMESGAETSSAPIFQMAALSGDNGYSHYDMCGTDGHELYDRVGTSFTPHGTYINDIRTLNYLLNTDIQDIATKAFGYGLYVYNWAGNSTSARTGIAGIVFTPASSTSQAISVKHSSTEIVLMNTKGGTFTYPSSLGVTGASKGYFDTNNNWINQGSVSYTSTSITPAAGTTVRLTFSGYGGSTYYKVTNHNSGKVFDVPNWSTSDGVQLQQYSYTGGTNQQFRLVDNGNGYYFIVGRNSGKALRSSGGKIVQNTFDITFWSEQFQLVANGSYYQLTNRSSGNCVEVANGSTSNNALIQEGACNSGYWRQQFTFDSVTNAAPPLTTRVINQATIMSPEPIVGVYPNPVSAILQLNVPKGLANSEVKIFDLGGKLVAKVWVVETKQIDVSNLKAGTYFLRITNSNESRSVKFVKVDH